MVYQPGAAGDVRGILLTLAGVGACAGYTVLTRRLLVNDASLPVVLLQQTAALVFAVLLARGAQLLHSGAFSAASLSAVTWLAAAASGILYYGLAFWVYLEGLRVVPGLGGRSLPPTHSRLRRRRREPHRGTTGSPPVARRRARRPRLRGGGPVATQGRGAVDVGAAADPFVGYGSMW